ncbi:MAG: transporter substrate-binding domain-containing protein, partial [Candidatus Omnitrophica bacterium]|nr:transporter substrate-binding domain-containing protein [Candidatus Omnitrophota bacterium]
MNKKNLFHFFATLFIAACVLSTTNKINAAPEESISEVEIEESLLFLGTDSFAPYSFLDKNIPTGYAVDLTKVLSATLDKKIKIELKPWKECLSDLKVGKADGLIGAPVSEEFPKFITYSIPVAKLDFAIFVETSNKYVNSLKSLEGTVVGVSEHSPIIDTLKKNGRLKLVITPSTLDAFKKIKQREVTAVIAEKEVALYCIRQNRIKNLKIIGCPVGPIYEYALAISSNKQHLLKDVNIAIGTMTKNDMLSYLKRKWFGIKLVEPFPWKKVSIVIGIITGILLLMMGVLWVISLNATVRTKTRQIQLMSEKMIAKDKLAVLGKLAGQIAHELRTPLSIISNSVFLLHKEGTKNRELF